MVPSPELAGLLDRHDVAGLLHDADQGRVPAVAGAVLAQLVRGDVEAPGAEAGLLLDAHDGGGEPAGVRLVDLEDVESEALGRLRADTGKPGQLIDEVLDGSGEHLPAPGGSHRITASPHAGKAHASGKRSQAPTTNKSSPPE